MQSVHRTVLRQGSGWSDGLRLFLVLRHHGLAPLRLQNKAMAVAAGKVLCDACRVPTQGCIATQERSQALIAVI